MIALTVLAVASLGALGGLIAASQQLKDGETRQVRARLLDASAQRFVLINKYPTSATNWQTGAKDLVTTCTQPCNLMPIGSAGPWVPDPTTPAAVGTINGPISGSNLATDLSVGAYFKVNVDGTLMALTSSTNPSVAAGTTCDAVPVDTYCREILVTTSMSPIVGGGPWTAWPPVQIVPVQNGTSTVLTYGSTVYTVWIRVSKKGDTPAQALYYTDTFVK
jgi:type II secretory pathway pseudopilin PulG